MSDAIFFVGGLLVLFAISFAGAWALTTLLAASRKIRPPASETPVRMRSTSGMHRSQFMVEEPGGWVFSAPISRDRYVPLRRGESLVIEAPREDGLMLFRTSVIDRRTDPHVLLTARPKAVSYIDRRVEPRRRDVEGSVVYIDGGNGVLRDLSDGGAKVGVVGRRLPGERVKLEIPWRAQPIYAAVLDVLPGRDSSVSDIRLCFEEPVSWAAQKAKTAPAV